MRRMLIAYGLDPDRITKVTSYADRVLFKPLSPYDPINRRVSILVEYPKEKGVIKELKGKR